MITLRRLLRLVFPPPRAPVRWPAAVPVLAFTIAVVAGCVALQLAHLVSFSRWSPLAAMAFAPWIWWLHVTGRSGLGRWRARIVLASRLLLLTALVITLCEPRVLRRDERMTIVFAVDRSASVTPEATQNALRFVLDAVAGKPPQDRAALIFFGRDAAVELPPSMVLPFEAINVSIDREGTNLAAGLVLGAALLPLEHQGRVVLISDGVATDGEVAIALDDLAQKRIAVDVVPIDYQYEQEAWLESLTLPRSVKLGETFEVAVVLSSLKEGSGTLRLEQNGQLVFEGEVRFAAGKNRFLIPVRLPEAGYYEYSAHLATAADTWPANNTALAFLNLEGQRRVLLLTDPEGDERDWQRFAQALRTSRREVDVMSAFACPHDPLALMPYDAIVLANVPRTAFDDIQLGAVHDAVYHQGSGLLMVGGAQSFGPGGYGRTPIEAALPVSMDVSQKKILPKGALVIVLHTCEFPEGNTWAKRITKQAIEVLSPRDEVGALAYTGSGDWLFQLTPASEYERLVPLINNAQIGDMPSFDPTMRLGLAALTASDAATKHMIIISDGDPSPPVPELLASFVAAKVSVSTVAIFPHGDRESDTLRAIAGATGGRYYWPKESSSLPAIFIKEAKTLRRNAIVNKTFVPTVAYDSPVLKGLGGPPALRGYVLTTPKERALVVLDGPEEDELDPVLATWRHGVGAAAAFTSDLSPNWGADWVQWEHYDAFVNQLLTEIARSHEETDLTLATTVLGQEATVVVEDRGEATGTLAMQARVRDPRGTWRDVALAQAGPRRFEGRFPLAGQGRYQVTAVGLGAQREQRVHTGFAVPYEREFLRFRSDPGQLRAIAERTGGRLLRGDETGEEIYHPERHAKESSRAIVDWLLLILACWIPWDVGLRRVHLELRWPGRRRASPLAGPPDERMASLLARKRDVATQLEGKTTAPRSGKPAAATPAASPAPSKRDETRADVKTTERLLDAKRRLKDKRGT